MKCPICNKGTLHREIKPQQFTYKNKSITLDQPGLWCDTCKEGILEGADIKATEPAFNNFSNEVDNNAT